MKVVQVLNHFLPQKIAGTEVYVWALSKQLQTLGHHVVIVIPNYNNAQSEYYNYDELNVFKYAETSLVDRALVMGFKSPNGLAEFVNYLQLNKPDIVHFHELAGSNGITLQHVIAAKNAGTKVLFTFHLAGYSCKTGTLFYKESIQCNGLIDIAKCSSCYLQSKGYQNVGWFLNSFSRILFTLNINSIKWNNKIGTALGTYFLIDKQKKDFDLLINHSDKVITLTNWYKEMLLLNGVAADKIEFIPQGLPLDVIFRKEEKINKTVNCLRLIFLGRISYFKGLHLLIEALIQLPKDSITLDIYGQNDGSDYEKLQKQKSINFSNIRWCGKLEQKEVISKMKQYDALCICSTFSEMSPLVIQEAFAAKVPVLASNVYGNAEQITDGKNGWLFKFNDSNDLKNKLQHLINEPLLIEYAKQHIAPVKSFETVAEEHEKLYKEILAAE